MSVSERDPLTGHQMTGHEWNGIKELNTPVPWPVWFFLTIAFLFGVGYWILMPAWPLGYSYTKGLLGIDQRQIVTEKVHRAALERGGWMRKVAAMDYAAIQADPTLMENVRERGHVLFGDNCAACHGSHATGGPGFPNLTDKDWLWGGDPATIAETIRVGVNSEHPDSRISQMLPFGRDKMLDETAIQNVADYVLSLSRPGFAKGANARSAAAGKAVFAANCVSCHGENAKGNPQVGAPNLTDSAWLYGGDMQSVLTTIENGRQGQMPAWESRLGPVDRKILTLYVLDQGRRP